MSRDTKIIKESDLYDLINQIPDELIANCICDFFESDDLISGDSVKNQSDIEKIQIDVNELEDSSDSKANIIDLINEEVTYNIMHLVAQKMCHKSKKYQKFFTQIFVEDDSNQGVDTPYDVLSSRISSKLMGLYFNAFIDLE